MGLHATLAERMHQVAFDALYNRSLVYNTCWEDPAVDRQALELRPTDRMLVITSAGCNVLDYALCGPERIDAVDANPRQTALLELKLAGIRRLAFDDFFEIFGHGRHPRFREIYGDVLRADLSPFASEYWDRNGKWFHRRDERDTFYYYGLSGVVARTFRAYFTARPRLRAGLYALFDARTLEEQRAIYDERVQPLLWSKAMQWCLSRQLFMSMLGVPHAQHEEVRRQHAGGVAAFIREAIEYVFRCLPIGDNYFWRVYMLGNYSRDACPEYLKAGNFAALKAGLADRVHPHTTTVTAFLRDRDASVSRYVLLDHMDWMSGLRTDALAEEWHYILQRATPDARVLFRSAHAEPAYLRALEVPGYGRLMDRLCFHRELARDLQKLDRVHTYAGFHIADFAPA